MEEGRARWRELTGPTWITAERQTAGRGRRGRAWSDPAGNFAGTLVLPGVSDPETAALHSFVAALALDEAFVTLTGRAEAFSLKWPNDVLMNGGKCAGILLETLADRGRIAGLMIGVGVNLARAPEPETLEAGALAPVSLAGETGLVVTPEDFLAALAPAFAAWQARFSTYGFAPIREAWLARAARLGGEITARLPAEIIAGTFRTVDETGRLVLSTPQGERCIAAGDVFF